MVEERKPEEMYREYINRSLNNTKYNYEQDIEACLFIKRSAEIEGILERNDEMLFLKVFREEFERIFKKK